MDYEKYQTLLFDKNDRVLTVTLNRPDKLNAIDGDMHIELSQVFEEINRDRSVDIVILTGAGRAFCALDWDAARSQHPGTPERYLGEYCFQAASAPRGSDRLALAEAQRDAVLRVDGVAEQGAVAQRGRARVVAGQRPQVGVLRDHRGVVHHGIEHAVRPAAFVERDLEIVHRSRAGHVEREDALALDAHEDAHRGIAAFW